MSYRELSMIEVKEVLRRHEAGQGLREIARETGLDRKTVRRYVKAATGAGVDEASVQRVVQQVQVRPPPAPSEPRQVLEAHRDKVQSWLQPATPGQRPLRLTKVHVLLGRLGVEVTYATLRRWAHDELGWRERKPTVRVDDPEPGQEVQVDFGEMGLVLDAKTGRRRKLHCLIVTLTYSRMLFAWPTFEQTTEAVCEGLDAAWAFFDGVPARVLVDNAKSMVTTAHATAPRANDAFADYAQARGFFIDTARVRQPKDKPRVENQVPFVRESWFDGERFGDLDDIRRSAERWCHAAVKRVHGTTRQVVREHYERDEKPVMRPAPTERFDVPLWTDAKVHPDHHVQVQCALYSVPTRYIGRTVRVRADGALVRIYLRGELVKTHPRQARGGRCTDPNDYPTGQAAYATRSFETLIAKAHNKGVHVGRYAERLFDRPLPWTTMRQGYASEAVRHVRCGEGRRGLRTLVELRRRRRAAHRTHAQASDARRVRGACGRQAARLVTVAPLRSRRCQLSHARAPGGPVMTASNMTLDPELRAALKKLKLGKLIDTLPERLVLAKKSKMSHEELLLLMLRDEVDRRESTATTRRARDAGLCPDMVLERWDDTAKVTFDRHVLDELVCLRFIEARRNVVILGPVGVGKTFLATALGHIACRHRFHVHFTRADDMLRRLKQSRLDNSRDAMMTELSTVDLLIIDDFALEPMDRDESRDVYQLFVERNGRVATVVTSNRDTSEWIAAFDDVLLAQSAVDRLVNNAYDLIVEGESYRPRLKPVVRRDEPPPPVPITKPDLPIGRRRKR